MPIMFEFVTRRWQALSGFMWLAITIMSLIPVASLPEISGSDKTHHLIAYGLLMFPVALVKPPAWKWFGVGFVVWSGMIELIQPYVNRYGEWLDLLANSVGVLCAVLLAEFARRFRI